LSPPLIATSVLDEHLKDVGSFASLGLALLVLFTNRRAESLEGWQEGQRRTSKTRARWDIALDDILFVATLLLLSSLLPLLHDGRGELNVGRDRGAVRCLFVLVWFGFAVLLLFQGWVFHAASVATATLPGRRKATRA
jgi:hypothetical protein